MRSTTAHLAALAALLSASCAEQFSSVTFPESALRRAEAASTQPRARWRFMDHFVTGGEFLRTSYQPTRLRGDGRNADGTAPEPPLLELDPYLRGAEYEIGRCGVAGTTDLVQNEASIDPDGGGSDLCHGSARTLRILWEGREVPIAPRLSVTRIFDIAEMGDFSACTRCVWLYETGLQGCERIRFEQSAALLTARDSTTGARRWRIETWGAPEDHAEPGHQARCYAKQVDRRKRVSYVAADSTFYLPFLAYLAEVAP